MGLVDSEKHTDGEPGSIASSMSAVAVAKARTPPCSLPFRCSPTPWIGGGGDGGNGNS